MATAKLETAAERYRRIKAEKEKADVLEPVECECGMTWQAKRFKIDFWITSGILPMSFAEKMVKATQKAGGDAASVVKTMATDEVFKSVAFASKVVTHTAVDPKIVAEPKDAKEIGQDEVMTCCYHRLLNWQMKGGDGAAELETFRTE